MDFATATFLKAWKTLKAVYTTLAQLEAQYRPLLKRLDSAPGLPCEKPTRSYWQDDPPFPELTDIRSDELPSQADVVIIGSGITGASVARTLLEEVSRKGRQISIVVLEARQLVSGATGRNGGHIKASAYESFDFIHSKHGGKDSAEAVRFQLMHLDCLVDLCREEKFDLAECRKVETSDIFLDTKEFEEAKDKVKKLKEHLPEVEIKVLEGDELKTVSFICYPMTAAGNLII
jgi:hypothetical protein